MSYKINLGEWGSVFAVPSALVDNHIKLASESALKVLLYILRNSDADNTLDSISKAIGVHSSEVANAVQFWLERGLIMSGDNMLLEPSSNKQAQTVTTDTAEKTRPESKKPRNISRVQRPDASFVAQRLQDDEMLRHFIDDVQFMLAKPLSNSDLSTLVMLHETDGLPYEVLSMLINYCVSIGKNNMRFIERMGIQWASEGIDTIAYAEQKIELLTRSNGAWDKVSRLFGLKNVGNPTKTQLELSDTWVNKFKFSDDMLLQAYDRCVDTKGEYNIKYINAILQKWYNASVFNLDDLTALDSKGAPKKQAAKQNDTSKRKASYDINDFKNKSLFDD